MGTDVYEKRGALSLTLLFYLEGYFWEFRKRKSYDKERDYEFNASIHYPFKEDFAEVIYKIDTWTEAHDEYLNVLDKQKKEG
ncbi:hypothetical protein [Heliorestis convoluta]|uniref:Uncharacterized protein n=1 Tax=Heliorestis convoluta TaxID=356322 RepID=A0A5Q2MYG6_9FIRM|nr:hypothetical protein [Heliorestis convoluta]QGG47687.1 hypothetical protein FTV88_1587 [Heliorestis convoluta]